MNLSFSAFAMIKGKHYGGDFSRASSRSQHYRRPSVQDLRDTMIMLPDGWEEFLTDDGHPYYYHKATNSTQWEFPTSKLN